jgi:hypothetical protein
MNWKRVAVCALLTLLLELGETLRQARSHRKSCRKASRDPGPTRAPVPYLVPAGTLAGLMFHVALMSRCISRIKSGQEGPLVLVGYSEDTGRPRNTFSTLTSHWMST